MNWLTSMFITYVVKNWKTTTVGVIGFLFSHFLGPWLSSHGYDPTTVQGVILAIVAILAKDGNVSNAPTPLPSPRAVPVSDGMASGG